MKRPRTVVVLLVAAATLHTVTSSEDESYPIRIATTASSHAADGLNLLPSLNHNGTRMSFTTTSMIWGNAASACTDPNVTCSQVMVLDLENNLVAAGSSMATGWGDSASSKSQIDAQGNKVVFTTYADNLVPGTQPGVIDVIVKDIPSGALVQANKATDGEPGRFEAKRDDDFYGTACRIWCGNPSISADGSTIAYSSWSSNLIANDTNDRPDVFAHRVETGTRLISTTPSGSPGNDASFVETTGRYVSQDGHYFVFTSAASDLTIDTVPPCPESTSSWPYTAQACPQVYLRDVSRNETRLVSIDSQGRAGNAMSLAAIISDDGTRAAYVTAASNIVGQQSIPYAQVVHVNLLTGKQQVVTKTAGGTLGDGAAGWLSLSSDGKRLAFMSSASNLQGGGRSQQAFIFDEETGQIQQVSRTASNARGAGAVHSLSISGDGLRVAFAAESKGWVVDDGPPGSYNIYLVHLDTLAAPSASHQTPAILPVTSLACIGLAVFIQTSVRKLS